MVRKYKYEPEPIKKVKGNPKKNIFFLILTIIMFTGISFATVYFVYRYDDERENTMKSGLINLTFTEESSSDINLQNTVPMTDDVGKQNPPYEFTIENTSPIPLNVKIGLDIIGTSTIDLSMIKYALYIEKEENQTEETSGNLGELDEEKTLYEINQLAPETPQKVKLVFWIDYSYDGSDGGSFSAKIKATGEQYNYIYEEPPAE